MSAARGKYIAKHRLEELDRLLSARDKALLGSLQGCRYMVTGQVARLHFSDSATPTAAVRAAARVMNKLRDSGLVEALERRVGGVRAGSGSYVWVLTESGVNLLHFGETDYVPRKRSFEPSLNFLKHTLAAAEICVQLAEISRSKGIELVKVESEPDCWRPYTGEDGKPAAMKPDIFAITASGEYVDNWFIEVDMNTESPCVIVEKCRRYSVYRRTGLEQKEYGVFPLVVWLVNTASRKAKLEQYIAESREIPESYKPMFAVIMPDMFERLICGGLEALAAAQAGTGVTDTPSPSAKLPTGAETALNGTETALNGKECDD